MFLFPENYFLSKSRKLCYLLGPLNLFLDESSGISQDRLSRPHSFNVSREQTQLDGPSESGSTPFWSTAGSLLGTVEHGEPLPCMEKSILHWNWKAGVEQSGSNRELLDECCSLKTYWSCYLTKRLCFPSKFYFGVWLLSKHLRDLSNNTTLEFPLVWKSQVP